MGVWKARDAAANGNDNSHDSSSGKPQRPTTPWTSARGEYRNLVRPLRRHRIDGWKKSASEPLPTWQGLAHRWGPWNKF